MIDRCLPRLLFISLLFTLPAMAAERGPAVSDYPAERIAEDVYVIHGPLGVPSVENQGFINNPGFVIGRDGVIVIDPIPDSRRESGTVFLDDFH
ncbi:MAG: hypothetical protein B6D72_10890 [gamma proteobacterium symbiont of Ctena orbiculata]|uniref:MBL fold metallo-hydrolase n=1 Tax=Candidatus Thiodiazotropha taylori TaxID=2792791 RepID=A0A944M830_9GAMM|nr:hypothetical protein [Candidatus Thiodiazotropha taylori]PUB81940.1 MAG: hypothetical protein DBP00_18285 [gamma proteobacterium symbiont of Ctena orbiculata]MBT2987969.1 hypothetical protein [Candidatus Thiodiazotropha taylori]MBT2997614.1 hypothetical protein [Candidatus Thiodiazotropha taylori]MBT3001965.1 hypothetical protein [Candidatus Thiodiazotropha taylori]